MVNNISSTGMQKLLLVTVLFVLLTIGTSLRPYQFTYQGKGAYKDGQGPHVYPEDRAKGELGMEMYPTGSNLPDCSHACGPCFPCRRVIVSFKCSVESCPVVYRCMCKGKYYHVPSN